MQQPTEERHCQICRRGRFTSGIIQHPPWVLYSGSSLWPPIMGCSQTFICRNRLLGQSICFNVLNTKGFSVKAHTSSTITSILLLNLQYNFADKIHSSLMSQFREVYAIFIIITRRNIITNLKYIVVYW